MRLPPTAATTVPVAVSEITALFRVLPDPPSVIVPMAALPVVSTTAPVLQAVTFPSIEDRLLFPVVCAALVDAPAGSGRLTTLTGCVTPDPSTATVAAIETG